MAKRLKNKLIETKLVDVIAGPDSYRDLPNLIRLSLDGQKAINVILSREETYADITPVRLNSNRVSAFVTIMRGCNNMCTFCVVPFTRGRERSRNPKSIIEECISLYNNGYKEVTLIGQNVDSYLWLGKYVNKNNYHKVNFANLLGLIASLLPNMRIRFCTSNPHDMTEDVLLVMKNYSNICKHIHLPVQSGSNNILRKMNRKYSREQYVQLIDKIRYLIPSCSISHDIISGFCGETDQDHLDTLSLMEYVKYDFGYMFTYSPRPNTLAFRSFKDDVSNKLKKTRLTDIINMQQKHSYYRMSTYIGTIQEVLIEGVSKKSNIHLYGRNSQNAIVVFPNNNLKIGDVVKVRITKHTSATLIGEKIN
jgi:tRNA-2-methylthio-N6-dimethylallyladenosine synthase